MLNANGPGFAGLYAGDLVEWKPGHWESTHKSTVLALLVFDDHVQVCFAHHGATVNASNFVRLVRRGKRHIAADKARTGFETLPYVRAADKVAESAYDERLATVGIGPQEAYSRAVTGADPHATRKLVRAMRSDSCTQCGGTGQRRDIERGDDNCAECDGTGKRSAA